MKTLKLLSRKITIDIDKIAKGIYKIHKETNNESLLMFGMFEANIMKLSEDGIKERVLNEFKSLDQDLFKSRINDFLKSVNKDISVSMLTIAQNNGILKY